MSVSVVNITSSSFFIGVSSPQTITIPATTAGNTLVVLAQFQADSAPTVNFHLGASAFTPYLSSNVTSQQGINGGTPRAQAFYLTSIAGGQTSVSVADTGLFGVIGWFVIYELTPCTPTSANGHTWTLDMGGHGVAASGTTIQPAALTGSDVASGNFGLLYFTTATLAANCNSANCNVTINAVPSAIDSGWTLDKTLNPTNQAGANGYAFGTASLSFTGTSTQPTLTTASTMWGCSTNICGSPTGAGGVTGKMVTFQPSIATQVQLTGNFEDLEGNPLANGYLRVLLPDAVLSNGTQLTATSIQVPLDNNGYIAGNFTVYPTDLFTGTYPFPVLYRVSVFAADGTRAWKSSHTMTVLSTNGSVQNIANCINLSSD